MTRITVNPSRWTGRSFYAETPAEWLKGEINALLWPGFNCDNCIGMIDHGCECAYYGAVAPGTPPEPWRVWARKLFERTSRHDPSL